MMKPLNERPVDSQYQRLLRDIMEHGRRSGNPEGAGSTPLIGPDPENLITLIGPNSLHFKYEDGFPIINERNMAPQESERLPVTIWKQAIAEMCAFVNGARTQTELEKFGCSWWASWVTPEKCAKRGLEAGDLGPGSYGAAFHDFPTTEGPTYNQFKNIIEQIREFPHLRTHFISPWIPQYTIRGTGKQQRVVVAPCHGWIHFRVLDNKLTLHMFQRSGDVPVGVPSNMVQYFALLLMVARATGTEPYEYVHSLSDAHIYVDQVPAVETMLSREPRRLATLTLDPSVTDFFAIRKEHFTLEDYNPHPGIKGIPVAI